MENKSTSWNLRDEEEKKIDDMPDSMHELLFQEKPKLEETGIKTRLCKESVLRGRRYQKLCLQ